VQGLLATLCATLILVNPVAKFAITLDPVGVAANTSLANVTQGEHSVRTEKAPT
jgi:hypothetical protein